MTKRNLTLLTGIGGILCAVAIGISDILLLGTNNSGMAIYNQAYWPFMAHRTTPELFWGANGSYTILLLFVGYTHWYLGAEPSAKRWMMAALVAMFFGLGVGSLAHYLIAVLSATYNATIRSTDIETANEIVLALEQTFLNPVAAIAFLFFAIGSGIFFVLTIRGKTVYPRWYAFFVPIILWPLSLLVTSQIPAPLGGYASVTFHWPTVIAFTLSTLILLRHSEIQRQIT